MAIAPDGRIALADASEGHVLVYAVDGSLQRVIGRKGRGPGELREPRFPAWTPSGLLAVGEGNGQVSVFNRDGGFVRSFQVEALGLSSLSARSDGGFIATTYGNNRGVLIVVDSLGENPRRLFPRSKPPVVHKPDHPLWNTVTQYWHVLQQDTAFVFATVSDSMWMVDLNSGKVIGTRIPVPEYEPSVPPDPKGPPDPRRGGNPFAWITAFPIAMGAWADEADGTIGISFVRGTLAYGDPTTLMIRQRTGGWIALTNAEPVYGARQTLVGLLSPNELKASLGRWSKP
jgi:hypothetical protein